MIELDYAEFHIPIFLAGVNWGTKLFKKQAKGELKLVYDRQQKEVIVHYGTKYVIIPTASNVAVMQPSMQETKAVEAPAPVIKPEAVKRGPGRPPISTPNAQVTTPQAHVFAPGPGKTNDR